MDERAMEEVMWKRERLRGGASCGVRGQEGDGRRRVIEGV
jgi:hypothetical protein